MPGISAGAVGAPDDARWADGDPRLVAAIHDEILAAPGRRITFARFMARALTEPGLGYYATSERRPTRDGDFLTAPELHPLFGRCLGRFVEAAWRGAGAPAGWRVREWGAGSGRLRDTALAGLAADDSSLVDLIEWERVDLGGRTDATDAPADLVLANEYLDALPVHRVVRQDGELREAWVTWRDGWFAQILGEPSSPDLLAHLAADGVELAEGGWVEICLAAGPAIRMMADGVAPGGILLVIDYGHEAAELTSPHRRAGTLLTYRDHRVDDDPFAAVGRADITAHVDLTALERVAAACGMVEAGRTTQARFLVDLGLGDLLSDLGRDPATPAADYVAARAAVARLLDPRHLGAFAVLAWRRPRDRSGLMAAASAADGAALPGFRPS